MQLCFATNNAHKLTEVRQMLGETIQIRSLTDIGCHEELPENQTTIAGNAEEKAQYVYRHYGIACFADDTGLEVDALQGAPGVYSARYAGPQRSDQDNIRRLLQELAGHTLRSARFRTVIALVLNDGQQHFFEGVVRGTIAQQPSGTAGFGYDPVFVPEGYRQSFASMTAREKNNISHRSLAVKQLVRFLQTSSQ